MRFGIQMFGVMIFGIHMFEVMTICILFTVRSVMTFGINVWNDDSQDQLFK